MQAAKYECGCIIDHRRSADNDIIGRRRKIRLREWEMDKGYSGLNPGFPDPLKAIVYTFSFWSIFSSIGVLIFVALILIILVRDQ